jgi:hypothetical protein
MASRLFGLCLSAWFCGLEAVESLERVHIEVDRDPAYIARIPFRARDNEHMEFPGRISFST